jgi:hypothetical protein
MIEEIDVPDFEMTPEIAAAMVEALSQEYKQPFYYTKEFSKYQNSEIHYITTAYSKNMVILNPKLNKLYVENKGKKLLTTATVMNILTHILALKPIGKDVSAYGTVEKKLPISEDISAKIGSYLSGETGTFEDQKSKVETKMKKYGLTKKGGRRRRVRKARKTRRV